MVMASKNSCTPPGTPVDVTLDFRKNASPMTMMPAIDVLITVSPLIVMPKTCQRGSWTPTWIAASARTVSVIAVSSILRFRVDDVQSLGAVLLQHGQAGAQHKQRLEDREPEEHRDAAVGLEDDRDRKSDRRDGQQPR